MIPILRRAGLFFLPHTDVLEMLIVGDGFQRAKRLLTANLDNRIYGGFAQINTMATHGRVDVVYQVILFRLLKSF